MLKISVTGHDEVGALGRRIGRRVPTASQAAIKEVGDLIGLSLRVKAPKWTHNLASGVAVETSSLNSVKITMPEYGLYLQEGIPHTVDPMLLTEWVMDKMGMNWPTAYHVAGKIKSKIETVGPRRNPFIDAAIAEAKPHIHDILKRHLRAAIK